MCVINNDEIARKTISNGLNHLLKEHNITKKRLAEDMSISQSVITEWGNGRLKPSIGDVVYLSDYFNVSTDYLLKGKKDNTISEVESEKENKMMLKRRINLQILKSGLYDYFYGSLRYIKKDNLGRTHLNPEKTNALSEKTSVSYERLKCFFYLSHPCLESNAINFNENDERNYPTSIEFDLMMHEDYCDSQNALALKRHLNDEYEILKKKKESENLDVYGFLKAENE